MNETLVTLSFTLPVSEAKSLLERIGGPECGSPNVVVPSTGTTHLRLKSEDVAMLMKGENAASQIRREERRCGEPAPAVVCSTRIWLLLSILRLGHS